MVYDKTRTRRTGSRTRSMSGPRRGTSKGKRRHCAKIKYKLIRSAILSASSRREGDATRVCLLPTTRCLLILRQIDRDLSDNQAAARSAETKAGNLGDWNQAGNREGAGTVLKLGEAGTVLKLRGGTETKFWKLWEGNTKLLVNNSRSPNN